MTTAAGRSGPVGDEPNRRNGRAERRADRQVFRASRAVLAARDGRPRIGDIAYVAYAGLLVALIVGAPLVRFAVLGLIEPDAAGVVASTGSGVASLVAAALVVLVALGGRVRGPVVPRPAAVQFLADSPLPRRLTLRRPFLGSLSALVALGVLGAGVLGLSRLLIPEGRIVASAGSSPESAFVISGAGPAEPGAVVAFLVGAVGFALLLGVLWLIGQRGSRRAVAWISAIAAATGLLGLIVPVVRLVTPWGWLGLLWTMVVGGPEAFVISQALSGTGSFSLFAVGSGWFASAVPAPTLWWPALAALAVGGASLLLVPRSLDALRSGALLDQARRWQQVGMLLQSGDAAGAIGGLRARPTRGRRIHLSLSGPFWLVVLRRTLVGARRTPGRVLLGSIVLLVCGLGVGFAVGLPDGVRWMLAVPSAFVAYLAVGVWCDAIRQGVDSAGTPTLYGRGPLALVLAGAVVPLGAAVVLGGLGALVGALASPAPGGPGLLVPVWWWLLLAVWIVVLRVFDAAKGPLPIGLLMPVPTPVGDVSSANVLLWQSDAVLLALIVGGGLTALLPVAPLAAVVVLLVMLAIVGSIGLARVQKLSRPA